ncbi:HAD hydrolase-like protein, partial [Pollutimonas sp. H1-120]|uniref:HAD hydrolase-like protein n=1 Tax=Pollutimonas sp. H1-120 TaxID=3148824 RepID=UPI003B530181
EFRGARFRRIVAELQDRHGQVDIEQLERMEQDMRANLATRLTNELTTIPGALEALEALSHYPSAVVSNGPETKIRAALKATGLTHYFDNRLFSG